MATTPNRSTRPRTLATTELRMREVVAYLGLGANEGDREQNLRSAILRLGSAPGIRMLRVSAFSESELVGDGPKQAPFLNGACAVATTLSAHALLSVCKALEAQAGRTLPAKKNYPRPLDLDVLLFGEERIDSRDLVVPHPRMFEREFVLQPLRELGVAEAALRALRPSSQPRLVTTTAEFVAQCTQWTEGGCVTGLVPTMGALHDGHRSLFERARKECDRVAATIFVNPLQFGPKEDLAAYPRNLPGDLELCRQAGVDVVFAPPPSEMYAPGFCSNVDVGREADTMEGAQRPGHFRGVSTVVARLFAIARPHRAYFGQKDAQQVAVIRRLVQDLGFPLRIIECPTVREVDGLAMSSRNVYLDPKDRAAAPVIARALRAAQAAFARGERDRDALMRIAREQIEAEPRAAIDYLELRSEGDLLPMPSGPVPDGRMLTAVRFSGGRPVRLLDNMSLRERAEQVGR